ncbi:hypothetical protein [Alkalihalobacillus sp. AL-G]|uniref:hypothetical protein n=1 Tax=Alkalihalobacillus sp. AL-G TaxID=2926399 RepID=UPI00272CE963|nr:hypothetical protein [Alkalihalobacillus sp. AL-G]WLD93180.1 hypothetical protein MOJ78_19650 [Alkalihalobacillus sp. AL-G]
MLYIDANGPEWSASDPDNLPALVKRLKSEPLDPIYEGIGNFIVPYRPSGTAGETKRFKGCTHFFGHFATSSYVFSLVTDEKTVIDSLTAEIRMNQCRPDYQKIKVNAKI